MAHLVINSTTNTFRVDFGIYADIVGAKMGVWWKKNVRFELASDESHVKTLVQNERDFNISFNGSNSSFKVDSINELSILSNQDLFNKLQAEMI